MWSRRLDVVGNGCDIVISIDLDRSDVNQPEPAGEDDGKLARERLDLPFHGPSF
jgi:hypothetical protein